MDIRKLGTPGNADRVGDRQKPAPPKLKDVLIPAPPRDEASISKSGRDTAARLASLAERARRGDDDRSEVVASALARLQRGELDGREAVEGAARRLLDANFISQ